MREIQDIGAAALAPRPTTSTAAPVVVGYDESPQSVSALQWAAAHAQSCGVPLRVVYAATPPSLRDTRLGDVPFGGTDRLRLATQVARRAADAVRDNHATLVVSGLGAVGNPAAELVMQSASASLVVVGRREATPGSSLGSVSFAVGAHARCPVLVVPGAARHDGTKPRVVVGVDGSSMAATAVVFAADAAARSGAELAVVSAWVRPAHEPWMPMGDEDRVVVDRAVSAAERCVDAAVALARRQHQEVEVIPCVREGRAFEVLMAEAVRASLLVVGSRGVGGFAGLMLGSVSRAALRQADLPVAVVRGGSP